jgi:hypothetical protein
MADAHDVTGFPHHCLMSGNLLMFETREVGFDNKVRVEQGQVEPCPEQVEDSLQRGKGSQAS